MEQKKKKQWQIHRKKDLRLCDDCFHGHHRIKLCFIFYGTDRNY